MIELFFALTLSFAVGLGYRRHRPGPGRAEDRDVLTAAQQVVVVLMGLPRDASAPLLNELGPETVRFLTTEIEQLPVLGSTAYHKLGRALAKKLSVAPHRLAEVARRDPAIVARAIREMLAVEPGCPRRVADGTPSSGATR